MSNHPRGRLTSAGKTTSQAAQIKAMTQPKRRVLTDAFIRGLPAAATGKRDYYNDALVPGLKLLVTDRGYKSYVLRRRLNPKATSASYLLLGQVGELTLQAARDKAREWIAQIKQGIDPRDHVRIERSNTVAVAAELFIEKHVTGLRKAKDVTSQVCRYIIEPWANRPLTSITRRDIISMIEEIAARGAKPQAANVLITTKTFFGWCVNRDLLPSSPADRISSVKLIGKLEPRQRVLNDNEIRAVWNGAEQLGYPLGPFLKMLLLIGQRKTAVAESRWREFDLVHRADPFWAIPAERSKVKAPHSVPLSNAMMKLLDELPRWSTTDYLFTNDGRTAITIGGLTKRKIDAAVGDIAPWRIHDLRRTMRTRLSPLAPKDICELCIGHGVKGMQAVYDLHEYQNEMRAALQAWSLRLQSIVEPPAPNVVSLSNRYQLNREDNEQLQENG